MMNPEMAVSDNPMVFVAATNIRTFSKKPSEIPVIDVESENEAPPEINPIPRPPIAKAKKSFTINKIKSTKEEFTSRQLKKLSFENRDSFLSTSVHRSRRDLRNLAAAKQNKPKPAPVVKERATRISMFQHNDRGVHVRLGLDLCDCQERFCTGCHYPCKMCRSTKCGHSCRNNRKWLYEQIIIEGTDVIVRHPAVN